MSRHVLTLDLKDDPAMIAAYREHHRHVWPEVVASLRKSGVEQMDIHLMGRRLVMIVDLRDGLDIRRVFATHRTSSSRVAEWERLMQSLQQPPPGAPAGDWWTLMEPVFTLDPSTPAAAHVFDRPR